LAAVLADPIKVALALAQLARVDIADPEVHAIQDIAVV